MKKFTTYLALAIGISLPIGEFKAEIIKPLSAIQQKILRVGVVEGTQPCSYRMNRVWEGLAVDVWTSLAHSEALAYVLVPAPTTKALLEMTRTGQVEVGIGCINITPERYEKYDFTIPIQEDGQGVLVTRRQNVVVPVIRSAILNPAWIRLLFATFVLVSILTICIWFVESHHRSLEKSPLVITHRLVKIFTILITGEGDSEIVDSIPGRGIILLAWIIRGLVGAAIVTVLTVNVVDDIKGSLTISISSLKDLELLNIGYRPGTASDDLIAGLGIIKKTPVGSISDSINLLVSKKIDALVADQLQLEYAKNKLDERGVTSLILLANTNPESQAFSLSPKLTPEIKNKINLGIIQFKRTGQILKIKKSILSEESGQSCALF